MRCRRGVARSRGGEEGRMLEGSWGGRDGMGLAKERRMEHRELKSAEVL